MRNALLAAATSVLLTCLAYADQQLYTTVEATCSCGTVIGKLDGTGSGYWLNFYPGPEIIYPEAFNGSWDPVDERYEGPGGSWITIEPSSATTGDYTYRDSSGTIHTGTYST